MAELQFTIVGRGPGWIAIDKPSGYFVHRSREGDADQKFVLQSLSEQVGHHLYPVHRLDRAASGVLIFATSSEDAARLQSSMKDARKEYLALVRQETPERFESRRPLSDRDRTPPVVREAHTEFERLATFFRLSIVRARIHTGRRHQIRRHLHHLAHQIIGDTSYGKGKINAFFREEYGLPRLFLHAHTIHFAPAETPQSGVPSGTIIAPLPVDLRAFLLRLPDVPEDLVATL